MKDDKKACWNCANYRALYTKGISCFSKTNNGICGITQTIKDKHEICSCWRNTYSIRTMQRKCTLTALCRIFDELTAIRQILEEQEIEKQENPFHREL